MPGLKPIGAVAYTYYIGKFEVSRDIVNKANAAAELKIDFFMLTSIQGPIRDTWPATGISFLEAAKFVNWLNATKGFKPAYKLEPYIQLWKSGDDGYNASNPYRNSKAIFVLPSVDEWSKAAYYDPKTSAYYKYPTGSNTPPLPVPSGTDAGTAVFQQVFKGPADVMSAGGLSPFGTMGQGGNAREVIETDSLMRHDNPTATRLICGGSWDGGLQGMSIMHGNGITAYTGGGVNGFRVVCLAAPGDVPK
jgi:formylglycine-generating enzyme required for sulfatase activity